jgi:hypothetical protein
MDGVVDVYMPDLKLWSAERARRYLAKRDYAESRGTASARSSARWVTWPLARTGWRGEASSSATS